MLELRNVSKSFDGKKVLDGVSLSLPEGSRTALLGPSGTGKSTLLRVVAGLEVPDGGEVRIGGCDVTDRPPEARGAVLIFQDYALFDNYDVAGNVAFSLKLRRRPRREIVAAVTEMLALVGLSGFENRTVSTLSGGEKQRVALARALAARPRLILMDEPFSGLDAALRGDVLSSTRELLASQVCTSVIVTHDWSEACAFGSRVAVMDGGRLLQCGEPEKLYCRPVSAAVAKMLGPVNLLSCERRSGRLDCCLGSFPCRGADEAGLLALRPDKITVRPGGGAVIESLSFGGSGWVCTLRAGSVRVRAQLPSPQGLDVGMACRAEIAAEDLWIVPEDGDCR